MSNISSKCYECYKWDRALRICEAKECIQQDVEDDPNTCPICRTALPYCRCESEYVEPNGL